jgi:2-polyprenyl-3-methyl-5-hydroxy-6-metoxy-1,4-benzoquinol methylase
MKCYLCNSKSFLKIKQGVRDNKDLSVIKCNNCGLVTLNSFDHIHEKFYENSNMHSKKIKISDWLSQTKKDDDRRLSFLLEKMKNKNILDFGCGNGGFLLNAQEISNNVVGIEPEMQFKNFFKKQKVRVYDSLTDIHEIKFDLITAFHVFEHLKDPLEILKSLSPFLAEGGEIIIEVPNSDDILLSLYKSNEFSDFTYWSQHLFLFNEKTLTDLISKSEFRINWIEQIQRYPISNHLYWLSKGLPNGHNIYSIFNNNKLNQEYSKVLKQEKMCDTLLLSIKK